MQGSAQAWLLPEELSVSMGGPVTAWQSLWDSVSIQSFWAARPGRCQQQDRCSAWRMRAGATPGHRWTVELGTWLLQGPQGWVFRAKRDSSLCRSHFPARRVRGGSFRLR